MNDLKNAKIDKREKWSEKIMFYDEFEIIDSPFQKIDEFKKSSERKPVRTDIAPEDYELIEKYIRQRDPQYDPQKKKNKFDNSKFVRELLMNFFNNVALDKSSFEDLYIILLMANPEDPETREGEIIGAIQGDDVFYSENTFNYHKGNKNKFNFIYHLREFNEENYNRLLLTLNYKDKLFFCVDENTQKDFVKTKIRLSDVYYDFDIDNAYFTIVNVNNYLDELYEGQYLCKGTSYYHKGVIALISPYDEFRVCMTCLWAFYHGFFNVSFEVKDIGEFHERTLPLTNNDELEKEYYSITTMHTREGALEMRIKDLDKDIELLTRMRQEKQDLLDEIRENK